MIGLLDIMYEYVDSLSTPSFMMASSVSSTLYNYGGFMSQ